VYSSIVLDSLSPTTHLPNFTLKAGPFATDFEARAQLEDFEWDVTIVEEPTLFDLQQQAGCF